jgi:hypothetical protein
MSTDFLSSLEEDKWTPVPELTNAERERLQQAIGAGLVEVHFRHEFNTPNGPATYDVAFSGDGVLLGEWQQAIGRECGATARPTVTAIAAELTPHGGRVKRGDADGIGSGGLRVLGVRRQLCDSHSSSPAAKAKDEPELSAEERAIAVLAGNPDLTTIAAVAKKAKVSREYLTRSCPTFKAAWKIAQASRKQTRRTLRGSKSKDGTLEAWE